MASGLKYLHSYRDRHGKLRHTFRRQGFKTVPLPGAPGSVELMQAYTNALAGVTTAPRVEIGASRSKPGSVAAAVALYFGSMTFGSLATSTQCARRWSLEKFREHYGDQSFAGLRRDHVERMLACAKPHTARNFLKALKGVVAVAVMAGLRPDDPTAGIRVKVRATAGYRTWPEDAIAQFEARHAIGSKARLAFGLLLFTAQRRGDVICMGRQHIKDGFIRVAQQKTKTVLEIPIIPELQEILAAHPAEHLTFLTTRGGEPFTGVRFTNWFRERCAEAGLPRGLVAHGLRKAACRRLAEAGCSASQIASISGHATLREVERYTKGVDQKRLAADAMKAVQKDKDRTELANPKTRLATMKPNPFKINGIK